MKQFIKYSDLTPKWWSILIWCVIGCTTGGVFEGWTDNGAPIITPRTYPLIDYNNIKHEYRDEFESIVFPKHNTTLTLYCGVHREWEDVKSRWKKVSDIRNIGHREEFEWRWTYHVQKNKR